MVLVGAIGGFRPGVYINIRYRQVALDLIRYPVTHEKRLIATLILYQNKQKKYAVKRNQQNVYISLPNLRMPPANIRRAEFFILLIPYNFFCPISLVITRGLSDNAFNALFDSVATLFNRPTFEHTHYIRLHWKKEVLDKPMFPVDYSAFWKL